MMRIKKNYLVSCEVTVVVEKVAQDHFQKILKSVDIASLKKLNKILEELEIHPKTGTGSPEELKHNLSGLWTRCLNKKDRLIYDIFEEPENFVVVISALGHY